MTVHLQKSAVSSSLKPCAGCGQTISDQFLLFALDGFWHCRCLTCSCCCAPLAQLGSSCFTRSGMILCRSDYIRLFGEAGVCRGCSSSIPAGEMVMKAKSYIFHIKCFVCSVCCKQLMPGDHFHCERGKLFCDQDKPATKTDQKKLYSPHKGTKTAEQTHEHVKTDHFLDR